MRKKTDGSSQIAQERIEILLALAKSPPFGMKEMAVRYVRLAQKLQQRYRVHIEKAAWRDFCKKCGSVRVFGHNTKIIHDSKNNSVVYVCACGAKMRLFLKKKAETKK